MKRIALSSSVVILLITLWGLYRADIIDKVDILLTAASTIATVVMAITIYQLDLTLKQLRFEALNRVYDILNNDIKEELNTIFEWAKKDMRAEEILGDTKSNDNSIKKNIDAVRYVSVAFNKVGYYVYKDFIDVSFIQEELGGLVVKSFLAIKPYLSYMRNQNESPEEPWFMRRFYLMITVACESYLKKHHPQTFEKILEDYGRDEDKTAYKNKQSIVPDKWLADDVKSWLKKHGFKA
ncbi:hypothetical protein PAP_09945 [Palaeococcus pacificus DY20341]|uniref:DUF4760 domain-containing protein n=1 Tax=Palaeococcus pacificus DY20341 TaxID=1343739 RepID=A0A075M0R4_9EURY|nr:hypothetical protein PAP_09945 [Palaeococcus pacificus DY20341]